MSIHTNANDEARNILRNLSNGNHKSRRRGRGNRTMVAIILLFLALLGGSLGYQFALHHHNVTHTNCVVTGKDRGLHYDGNQNRVHDEMRVYTSNCGTFKVTDIRLRGRFDSADVYGKLEVGKTYDITTMGYRIPLFSQFPDITSVTAK